MDEQRKVIIRRYGVGSEHEQICVQNIPSGVYINTFYVMGPIQGSKGSKPIYIVKDQGFKHKTEYRFSKTAALNLAHSFALERAQNVAKRSKCNLEDLTGL